MVTHSNITFLSSLKTQPTLKLPSGPEACIYSFHFGYNSSKAHRIHSLAASFFRQRRSQKAAMLGSWLYRKASGQPYCWKQSMWKPSHVPKRWKNPIPAKSAKQNLEPCIAAMTLLHLNDSRKLEGLYMSLHLAVSHMVLFWGIWDTWYLGCRSFIRMYREQPVR